jgi:hypothetical protein
MAVGFKFGLHILRDTAVFQFSIRDAWPIAVPSMGHRSL